MTTETAVRFLSEEYLAQLEQLPPGEQQSVPHVNVRVQFHATGTPRGTVDYHVLIEEGVVTGAGRGRLEGADLEITAAHRELADFETGDLHAATAFVTGRFAVTGDKAKLLDLMFVLQTGRYHQFTADLWSRTTR
ncbi:SCP2 sterol-binding domain-containing protein [Streptomyces sp. NPDC102270]|uniref:SCP2 sterol-binding domain-containing protein n=1 Tax=Streptomyces sp. NPDC102270 TaxID=3366150 RepID=UPI0038002F08